MDPPVGLVAAGLTVGEAKAELQKIVRAEFVTYGYVVDAGERLIGVLVMRDLLFADDATPVLDIMVPQPFSLRPETPVMDAMKEVLAHHFPVYPVCDGDGRILGLVRGYRLFESQAFQIITQAGRMVGVENEEQISTPLLRSFKFRHPWLQLNLLTAFVAGAVVSIFQDTIDQIVVLASFLPVLAGQSGNTGCQALAVTLRAMTLGELKSNAAARAVRKEALLGLANGLLVGVSAGLGMYLLAAQQGNENSLALALIVVAAMTGSCAVSGISGALVPLALRRLGADPATASSIFLTTATDVASMGLLLGLATWLLL
jgi:magnesium transporter